MRLERTSLPSAWRAIAHHFQHSYPDSDNGLLLTFSQLQRHIGLLSNQGDHWFPKQMDRLVACHVMTCASKTLASYIRAHAPSCVSGLQAIPRVSVPYSYTLSTNSVWYRLVLRIVMGLRWVKSTMSGAQ